MSSTIQDWRGISEIRLQNFAHTRRSNASRVTEAQATRVFSRARSSIRKTEFARPNYKTEGSAWDARVVRRVAQETYKGLKSELENGAADSWAAGSPLRERDVMQNLPRTGGWQYGAAEFGSQWGFCLDALKIEGSAHRSFSQVYTCVPKGRSPSVFLNQILKGADPCRDGSRRWQF
jgi:hypothetical protein